MQASGANARITFCEELAYGVVNPAGQFTQLSAAIAGVQLKANVEKLESSALSPKRGIRNARGGNVGVSGSIPFEAPVEGIGKLLKHALGVATTVDNGDGTFTHTIKRGPLPVGLSFEIGYLDITKFQLFEGVRIDKTAFSIGSQGLVTGSFDVIGATMKQSNVSADETPDVPDHVPYVHHEATITGVGGTLDTTNISFDITNDLDAVRLVGNRNISSLREGRGASTGNLTLLLKDDTYINAVLNEVETALTVSFANEFGEFEVKMPRVKFFGDAGAGISTDKGLVLAVDYTAIYDPVTETDLQFTITNTEPTL